ncbi:helix-turn-helix transcriptional regulator [Citrobacter sp. JGM124]|uniref:helix-turn-helix transcriptional regulator n=1 Tax=Citrobacter sp. JGM124 TaxID=2799789 RepID=UPI001BA78D75|nr:helix-turn-helix transcriptional regulator [Citrobacter sp. JGM124]MBS0848968.1 helix-turn-helix domain-containing protein [Citrobacter sp. JGM124]
MNITQSEPHGRMLDDSRQLLASFLRTRRESLDPERLGLPRSGRRRTPGLRREEVAQLADIGVTWYTWLEQGREVNPSANAMTAIATALQCSPAEARYLFILAGLPPSDSPEGAYCEGLSIASRRTLDALMPNPASIQKPNFDILGYNRHFCHMLGVDLDKVPVEERNCIYQYLTNETWRSRIEHNESLLPRFVGLFRAGITEHRDDPRWETLLAQFFSASSEFKALWDKRYEIRSIENHIKQYVHPQIGSFGMQQVNWFSAPRNGSRLLVYFPIDDAGERALQFFTEQERAHPTPLITG